MLVKILGAIDFAAAIAFLLLLFGIDPWLQFILFCAGLLFIKGLFIFSGDVLSVIDLVASVLLILSLVFTLPVLFLWVFALLLIAKAFVSFL